MERVRKVRRRYSVYNIGTGVEGGRVAEKEDDGQVLRL